MPQEICSSKHLRDKHQILISESRDLIKEIERSKEAKEYKLSSRYTLEHVSSFLLTHLESIKTFVNTNQNAINIHI